MKVLFLTQTSALGPASRFRVYQYLPYLKKEGIGCVVRPAIPEIFYEKLYMRPHPMRALGKFGLIAARRFSDVFWHAHFFDLVFLQKEVLPGLFPFFEHSLAKMQRKYVFDFDDAIFLPPPGKERGCGFRYAKAAQKIMAGASLVLAGNHYLADFARRYNERVEVLPTTIDTERYRFLPRRRPQHGPVIIGWIGSLSTGFYLNSLQGVLETLSRRFALQVHIIGNPYIRLPGVEVVHRDWSLERELSFLGELDIGISVLDEGEWSKGKCAAKTLQYMAAGVPSVSSRIGVHTEIIQEGVNGFLASTSQEWEEKLSLLIRDAGLASRIASQARQTVQERFSLQLYQPRLKEFLQRAIEG